MKRNSPVNYKNGVLHLMNHDLARVAEKYGTPCYVYSYSRVAEKLKALREAFSLPVHIHYAMKANSNRDLLRRLKADGVGIDVVSGGEIARALECGFRGGDIIFSGVGKTEAEIEMALGHSIRMFNVESPQELERIGRIASRLKATAFVSFRLNPNVNPKTHPYITTGFRENKFGMDKSFLPDLIKILKSHQPALRLVGLDFHIGSQLVDAKPFEEAAMKVIPLFEKLRNDGLPLSTMDIGGGFGISYDGKRKALDVKTFGKRMEKLLRPLECEVFCEPGRFLVADSGVLLTKVEYVKQTPFKTFVIVNTGMHHLIRPALYQAKHRILPLVKSAKGMKSVDVVGPICESADFLARKEKLPALKQGDVLAICDAGAYGFVMASDYNLQPKPAEVVLD